MRHARLTLSVSVAFLLISLSSCVGYEVFETRIQEIDQVLTAIKMEYMESIEFKTNLIKFILGANLVLGAAITLLQVIAGPGIRILTLVLGVVMTVSIGIKDIYIKVGYQELDEAIAQAQDKSDKFKDQYVSQNLKNQKVKEAFDRDVKMLREEIRMIKRQLARQKASVEFQFVGKAFAGYETNSIITDEQVEIKGEASDENLENARARAVENAVHNLAARMANEFVAIVGDSLNQEKIAELYEFNLRLLSPRLMSSRKFEYDEGTGVFRVSVVLLVSRELLEDIYADIDIGHFNGADRDSVWNVLHSTIAR